MHPQLRIVSLSMLMLLNAELSFSQKYNYETSMLQCINLIDSNFSAPAYIRAAKAFETIASFEKSKWLPYYYASFTNIMLGTMDSDKSSKDKYFESGMIMIDAACKLEPFNSEVIAMKAFALQMYISVAPKSRAIFNHTTLNNLLSKSIELNPENPRAYYLKAAGLFYTPELFGGGKKNALRWFLIADEKYKSAQYETIFPHWGAAWVTYMIGKCN
ncbi:MAG: hypothetical protein LH473_04960 [Chitinophagales bacterium]|nr:hypothetical protein [Chitinophagales bacterium]